MAKNKKNKSVVFLVLGIVILIILIVSIILINRNNSKVNKENDEEMNKEVISDKKDNLLNEYENNKNPTIDIMGNNNVSKDGNQINNISSKLKEIKKIDDLEISDIEVNFDGELTNITGIVSNKTEKEIDADFIYADIIDDNNEVVKKIDVYIGKVKAGGKIKLFIECQSNISNLNDIRFSK